MRWPSVLLLMGGLGCVGGTRAVEPSALLEVADFSRPVVSPDGRQVAFRVEQASIGRNTYDAFWYVQDVDGRSLPRRIADGGFVRRDTAGIPLPASASWSPDGRWIYYLAQVDGKLDVWRASTDGAGAMAVTSDPADVREFALADGGRTLKYSVGATREAVLEAEQAEYEAGIHVDGSVPVGQGLYRSGNLDGRLATQRYGKVWFARVPLLADLPDRWKAVDLGTKKIRDLGDSDGVDGGADPDKRYPDAWIVERSPQGGRVAILTRVGERDSLRYKPDVRLSAALPGGGSSETVCKAAACTGKAITSVQWRPYSDEVLFTVTDPAAGLAQSIYRWNIRSGVVLPVAHSAGLLNGGREPTSNCGVSFAALVCVGAAADQPPRLERIDLETGARQVLFDPNAALAQAMARSNSPKLLSWKDAKGEVFTGQFYAANSDSGAVSPLFVNYYRCAGFVRGGVGDEWPFASLAAHGISALCINAAPYAVDPIARFDTGLAAVESAVKLLSARGNIDCTRVGMGGLSFGSEVTLWAAMKSPLLAAASVSSVSVSPSYYLLGSLKGDLFTSGLKDFWGLGSPKETPAQWRALSPAYNLDKITAPVLMQVPEQEYLQAVDYVIPLIRRDIADLYVFPNEPHQKFQPRHKLAVYTRNMDWFRFWLQGYEDPDPSKAVQYRQWREMRDRLDHMRFSGSKACGGRVG